VWHALSGALCAPYALSQETDVTEPDWLPAAIRRAGVERRLAAGQCLFRQGNRTVGLFLVVSGRVRLVRVDRSGREAVLHSAAAGETIAEASLFSPTYLCDAVATTNAVVRLFPKAALLTQLRRDPEAAEAFMAKLARQVMTLRTSLERRNIRSARDRVRHYLAVNVGADRRTVVLPGTLKELAADLGLTHEALYRTLARMQQDGEVEQRYGKLRLAKAPDDLQRS
jgi:CRP-like cAMP-binding protein